MMGDDWIDLEAFKKESERRINAPLILNLFDCGEVEKPVFPKFDLKAYEARLQKEMEVALNKTWADYYAQVPYGEKMLVWDPPTTDSWTDLSVTVEKYKTQTMAKYSQNDNWWIGELSQPPGPCPIPNCPCGAPTPKRPNELLREKLPGLDEIVSCPEQTGRTCADTKRRVWGAVIHLNDVHEWSRDKIADWLETLDIDLTFPGEDPFRA